MARLRRLWPVIVLAPLSLLVDATARADEPGSPGLRPYLHIDHLGRTLVDVCPEHEPGGRRCFAQRVVQHPLKPVPAPAGSDPACASMGGGGYGSSPPPGTMSPSDVLAAYNIPSGSSAGGAIVALVELPSTHAKADVNAYRAHYGIPTLPDCPTNAAGVPTPGGTACFARVGQDGTVNTVSSSDCPGWSGETGLDMDMVSAACPDCSIVLVEANNTNNLDAMNSVAAKTVGAAAISNSWGAPESGYDSDSSYASPGVLVLAASGDAAYLNEDEGANTPNFPASSPHVIAVGGTTLQKSGGSYSEVVWNDDALGGGGAGGSGCSTEFAMPGYQSGSGFSFGVCPKRASVDISAAAEFAPSSGGGGIAAYDFDDGGFNAVVGTSAASPLVAAIMVRVGLAGTDNHALFYSNISAFNDVTTGHNDNRGLCAGVMCTAGVGWDGPTGLGSPNATALAALGGGPPPGDGGPPGDSGGSGPPLDSGSSGPPGDSGGGPMGDAGGPGTGGMGSPCTGPSQCSAANMCVSPSSGMPAICTQACDSSRPCPGGYGCEGGYCFPGVNDTSMGKNQSNGGCACRASAPGGRWSEAGALAFGVFLLTRRRRPRRR